MTKPAVKRGRLLVADVGGTWTTLAIARAGTDPAIAAYRVYPSQDFNELEAIVADFLVQPEAAKLDGRIEAACFSVAGPVADNASKLTNLGWEVNAAKLAQSLGLRTVKLINDFAAAGQGIGHLAESDVETLQAGQPVEGGTRLIIGAGTGLGVGVATWQEGGYTVHPSEAGHSDFAPVDGQQDLLLAHLRRSFGRVSYERVVSGPGLMRIFSFLQEAGTGIPSRQLLDATRKRNDTAELIAEFAISRLDPLAVKALDLFVAVYGAFAGNMALATLPYGGVYISGGIAPKIAAKLKDGMFTHAFCGKGRFSELLARITVRLVKNPQVGLLGAILEADRLRG